MIARLRQLLAAPIFQGDDDKTHAADLLNTTLLTILLGIVLYGLIAPILDILLIRRISVVGAMIGLLLGTLFIMRRGYVRLAGGITVGGLWAMLTYAALTSGGIRAPAIGGYVILVLSAGLLLGRQAAVGVASASALASLAFVYAARAGRMSAPAAIHSDTSIWIANTVYLIVAAVLLNRTVDSINRALGRARRELDERRQAEQALRESEERYRIVSQLVSDYAFSYQIADDGAIALEWVTDALTRITGYTQADMITADNWQTTTHPEDLPIAMQRRQRLHAGLPDVSEYRIFAKDGRILWLRYYSRPVWDAACRRVVRVYGAVQDITQLKRLEQQLGQTQKLETVGRLAGGIAHDFNNILTIILSNAMLALDSLDQRHPLRQEIEDVQQAAIRAAELTKQLLAFSRQQVLLPRILNLNAIVAEIGKLMRPLIGEDIELIIRLEPQLGQIKADPGQIEQVIMNLAINARDAMPKGGTLLIETANVDLDEAYSHDHVNVQPGAYILLAISDTGIGMDAATRARIFEPFFTTKDQGKGTGLGLATVHGIVNQSGGHVWVYSEPGHGSSFKVYLPCVEETAVAARAPAPTQSTRGDGTILLVEDEPVVRGLAARILRGQGYQVLEAANGRIALEIAANHTGAIDVLLSDVIMPAGISSRELAEQLTRQNARMRVLYMSGYTDDAITHHGVLDAGVAFLQKPFTPAELLRKVRETLQE
jgi:PAS domain S-box-containing protein